MQKSFKIIVAIDKKNGIGNKNQLPWHLKADLKHFREITVSTLDPSKQNAVIMGRKTWESIPRNFRPLPNRQNIVLSSQLNPDVPPNVGTYNNFDSALSTISKNTSIENIFIVGGMQLYKQILTHPKCDELIVTQILSEFNCDTFFPEFLDIFTEVSRSDLYKEDDLQFYFSTYKKKS